MCLALPWLQWVTSRGGRESLPKGPTDMVLTICMLLCLWSSHAHDSAALTSFSTPLKFLHNTSLVMALLLSVLEAMHYVIYGNMLICFHAQLYTQRYSWLCCLSCLITQSQMSRQLLLFTLVIEVQLLVLFGMTFQNKRKISPEPTPHHHGNGKICVADQQTYHGLPAGPAMHALASFQATARFALMSACLALLAIPHLSGFFVKLFLIFPIS